MARSKKYLYPIPEQNLCTLMKLLDHPARPRILRQLLLQGTINVSTIRTEHQISSESLTIHLNKLYHHQLITYTERFPYSFYTVHRENLQKTIDQLIIWCTEMQQLLSQPPRHEHTHDTAPDQ